MNALRTIVERVRRLFEEGVTWVIMAKVSQRRHYITKSTFCIQIVKGKPGSR